ncbi:MAG: ShlB/FhaC/HecB family hemolysin secretion/activation protein, partial [Pseudomonadales bacterium]
MAARSPDRASKTGYRRSNRLQIIDGIGRLFALVLLTLALASQQVVWAQQEQRPGARLPELPDYTPPSSKSNAILPPVSLPNKSDTQSLQAGQRVFVRDYHFSGNTVLVDDELESLLKPYSNRDVGFTELAELRDTLTRTYIERGYMTSGAVIPPQTLKNDVLEIRLIEGVLADVEVKTNGRLRESYVRKRMQRGGIDPVNVKEIEERLQILLHQDERIAQIEASLTPGPQRAEAVLNLAVTEAQPYRTYLELSNYESPSVGSLRGLAQFTHANVTGLGDRFTATYRKSEGLDGIEGSYAIPLNAYDTVLDLHGQYTESDVVEKPFDDLDIESRSETYGFTLSQPVHRSASSRLELSLTAEYRRSKSFLLGSPFSFSEGVEQGV